MIPCDNLIRNNIRVSTKSLENAKVLALNTIALNNTSGSLSSEGTMSNLSVKSKFMKHSNTRQASGLRHRKMIEKHMLKAEELGKIRKGFNIAFRNVVKRWFVLYDDNQKPVGRGRKNIP